VPGQRRDRGGDDPAAQPTAECRCRALGSHGARGADRPDARCRAAAPAHIILGEYAAHCNQHRPHRARNLRPPHGSADHARDLAAAKAQRRRVLGGLISEYQQAA